MSQRRHVVGTLLLLVDAGRAGGHHRPGPAGAGADQRAVLVWALYDRGAAAWVALAICVLLWAAAFVLQYLVPGKRLVAAGVPTWVLVVAGLAGIVGFFVVPVIGLPLFFVGAVYLVQSLRARHLGRSLGSTWQAIIAVVTSQAIELAAGVLCVVVYVVAWSLR
jgi:uncharacterized protein